MDVNQAIRTRRTIAKFRDEPIPPVTLESVLAAGVWAPNHHLTEPWHFVIIGPETQGQLASSFGEWKAAKVPAEDSARYARVREEHERKFRAIPTVVAVAYKREGDEIQQREDYAATACAIQNVQLAAWAEGIGVKWSTAGIIRDSRTYRLLGIDPAQFEIVGLLFIGYPAEIPNRDRKRPLHDVIRRVP
jgi:nitroreductase